jgi:hypothetical protein
MRVWRGRVWRGRVWRGCRRLDRLFYLHFGLLDWLRGAFDFRISGRRFARTIRFVRLWRRRSMTDDVCLTSADIVLVSSRRRRGGGGRRSDRVTVRRHG